MIVICIGTRTTTSSSDVEKNSKKGDGAREDAHHARARGQDVRALP